LQFSLRLLGFQLARVRDGRGERTRFDVARARQILKRFQCRGREKRIREDAGDENGDDDRDEDRQRQPRAPHTLPTAAARIVKDGGTRLLI